MVPHSYRYAFAVLARSGAIDTGLADRLQGWAGVRNVRVLMYTTLDLDRVHAALFEVDALREFHRIAARELAKPG